MSDVCIYTTGDKQHGLGHVKRMLLLARTLEKRGVSVRFISEPNTLGWEVISKMGPPMHLSSEYPGGDMVIVDVENGPSETLLEMCRENSRRLVTFCGAAYPIHNYAEVEQLSDLVVCQSPFKLDRPAHVLQGIEFLMVDPAFTRCRSDPDGPLVVVMGGTDPHELTPKVKAALGYPRDRRTTLFPQNEPTLAPFFNNSSVLIGALGMTAYEAIAAGLPCILYGWSDDHVDTARWLEQAGCGVRCLGRWDEFDGRKLVDTIGLGYWQLKSQAARLIDGQGAGRVAEAICKLM